MHVELIGVPIDFGAGRRGVDMGPSAIRYAGLKSALEGLGHTVEDRGNVETPIAETCTVSEPKLKYVDCIIPVARRVYGRVASAMQAGHFPLTLGGDHSLSLGSVRGAARHKSLGVIWIDAHADFNTTETTPSGNIHGMPLAALAGLGDARLVTLGDDANPVNVNPANNPAMATAGTGDVLTGVIAGLMAQGLEPFAAAVAGVYLHGRAGEMLRADLGDAGMLAGDLLPMLPRAIRATRSAQGG